ncbi:hypothetical protein GCM10009102_06540 [Sphingomonas insulae]|uniref:Uncharacterized protein n=1 Tax=Sphingomonas insulae TaxID=424800 RepID=A0ABP3SRS6_9SPHN
MSGPDDIRPHSFIRFDARVTHPPRVVRCTRTVAHRPDRPKSLIRIAAGSGTMGDTAVVAAIVPILNTLDPATFLCI